MSRFLFYLFVQIKGKYITFNLRKSNRSKQCMVGGFYVIWGHESQHDSGMLPTNQCFLPSWKPSLLHHIIRKEDTIQLLKSKAPLHFVKKHSYNESKYMPSNFKVKN